MTKYKLIALISFCFLFSSANAQILKRISKRMENAAIETVSSKAEQKTTEETSKAFDTIFNGNNNGSIGSVGSSNSDAVPAAKYLFQNEVKMTMITGSDSMKINYLLPETGNFMCTVVAGTDVEGVSNYSIIDLDQDAMFIFLNQGGQKFKMSSDLKLDDVEESQDDTEYTITKTGKSKTVIGFLCEEYIIESDDLKINAWITNETDVRFPEGFYSMESKSQRTNQQWATEVDGFALEMTMIDKSKKRNNQTHLFCTSIGSSDLQIVSSEYSNLMH